MTLKLRFLTCGMGVILAKVVLQHYTVKQEWPGPVWVLNKNAWLPKPLLFPRELTVPLPSFPNEQKMENSGKNLEQPRIMPSLF